MSVHTHKMHMIRLLPLGLRLVRLSSQESQD